MAVDKIKELEIRQRLFRARTTAELQDVAALARMRLKDLQDQLLDSKPENIQILQGRAQAYKALLNELLREPAQIPKE